MGARAIFPLARGEEDAKRQMRVNPDKKHSLRILIQKSDSLLRRAQ